MGRRKTRRETTPDDEEDFGRSDGGVDGGDARNAAIQPSAGHQSVDSDRSDEDGARGEDSSSTEEDDGYIPPKLENKFLKALVKIKKKDATIYNKDDKLFSSADDTSSEPNEAGAQEGQKHKPMHLKDVRAQQLLEDGADAYSSSSADLEDDMPRANLLYNKKQEQNRREFLALLTMLENLKDGEEGKTSDTDGGFGGLRKAVLEASDPKQGEDSKTHELLDEIFGNSEELTEEDTFLKDYFKEQKWVVPEDSVQQHGTMDIDEEEEYMDKADQFESTYNFRFEEPGAQTLVNYPRVIDGSYRKTESKRKRQRERKKRRREEQARDREEVVKQKKNLKKHEIQAKYECDWCTICPFLLVMQNRLRHGG